MKLHYSNDGATNSRYRKIRSVINALKLEVTDVPHDSNADLSKLTVFNTLPLLETNEGTFFSSNTIIRYLAALSGNNLYGGDNLYQRALISQWLDITTCDFEAAVAGVAIARDGREVDSVKLLADIHKFLAFVESHLNGKKFLVGDSASLADYSLATSIAVVLTTLGEEERKAYPNVTAWYLSLVATDAIIGSADLPKEAHKAFRAKQPKQEKKAEKKQEKKAEKKQEKKPEPKPANDDDFDPFADDSTPAPAPAKPKPANDDDFDPFADDSTPAPAPAKPKPKVEEKKKKEKPVAKSIVVFDVKVYEQGFDLDGLWEKIKKEVVMDGLVWNQHPKKIPVVGKIQKLQVGCVIEDDKVATDDIFDKITAWDDDVQSIDIVSFNKL